MTSNDDILSLLSLIPSGADTAFAGLPTYISRPSSPSSIAILYIHDILGHTNLNARNLCDFYSRQLNATVYIPDFFNGSAPKPEEIPAQDFLQFKADHDKHITFPSILKVARELRQKYDRVGVIGYCFGGWSGFALGSSEHKRADGRMLIDCLSVAHPSWLSKEEIDNIAVPVQIIAPEHDSQFNADLKRHANAAIPTKIVPYEYCHFEGVVHRFASQPDFSEPTAEEVRKHEHARKSGDGARERKAFCRAQRSIVSWMREWLIEQ